MTTLHIDGITNMRFTQPYLIRMLVDIATLASMRVTVGPNAMGGKDVWRAWCMNTTSLDECTLFVEKDVVHLSLSTTKPYDLDAMLKLLDERMKIARKNVNIIERMIPEGVPA